MGRFQTINKEEQKKHAADLEIALTDFKIIQMNTSNDTVKPEADLDGIILVEEMEALKFIFSSKYFQKPLKMLQFLSDFQIYLLPFAYI